MAMQTQTAPSGIEHALTGKEKIQKLRELFADASELGKTALENVLKELTSQVSVTPPPPIERAGRAGSRLGKVSELTLIFPWVPGGAKRLRQGAERVPGQDQQLEAHHVRSC